MNTVFREPPIDPPEFTPRDWDDLHFEQKVNCLVDAMNHSPKAARLVERCYSEALSLGVNPLDYL